MTILCERGWAIEFVLGLDMLSFRSLIDSSNRCDARQRIELSMLVRGAVNADAKDFQKILAPYMETLGLDPKPQAKGVTEFMRAFNAAR